MTGEDNLDFGDQPSFAEDFLPRLEIDKEQLINVLTQIDKQLAEYEEYLLLEIAEETYANAYWDTDVDRDRNHSFFIVYTGRTIKLLQESMPGSVFTRMDEDDKIHDLYVDDVVIRFVTDKSHTVVHLFETRFEYLDIGCPSEKSVYQVWAEQMEECRKS